MKNVLKLLLPLLATLALASCATQAPRHPVTQSLAKGQVWQLVGIQGRPVSQSLSRPITLAFNPEAGTIHGHMACNTYSADYKVLNSQFSILNLQTTDIQCTVIGVNAEERYLSLLSKCTRITLTPTTLTLSNTGNKPLLEYELQ